MLEDLAQHFAGRSPLAVARDAFDVFLVYYIVYRALLVLRGTRAMQVGVGMGSGAQSVQCLAHQVRVAPAA